MRQYCIGLVPFRYVTGLNVMLCYRSNSASEVPISLVMASGCVSFDHTGCIVSVLCTYVGMLCRIFRLCPTPLTLALVSSEVGVMVHGYCLVSRGCLIANPV